MIMKRTTGTVPCNFYFHVLALTLYFSNLTSTELRRQIHIQSEQKRRAQIKDGFEELRNELPACLNKKMSKVALLHRSKYTV